jgi:predicted enzyme related to lactoylglutathione lyase
MTMHLSQLAGFIIDCDTDDMEAAATFWGAALGLAASRMDDPAEANYRRLGTDPNALHIEVQKVDHASRVHLDIVADVVEAEAARLEALGAKRIGKVHTWIVLEAPTGQRFCVVRAQTPTFTQTANTWD